MSLEFLITALVVVLVPGTGVVYTVAVGLTRGRWQSIAAAFGCTLGILPAVLASVLGLSALLHMGALAFQGLKFAGAAYLLYLAVQTLRASGPMDLMAGQASRTSALRTAVTGWLINILNPKLTIFFLAFLPQFVSPADPQAALTMLAMGGVFMAMTFVIFVLYGCFASLIGGRVLSSERAMNWMRRSVAAAFAGFGLKLALTSR
ncbi:LysE family translocator [Roseibium suaedae]|uniref:Threonine/homoserine/homoserine lactone efflux protein n=1 Tax=Roseibium suaedae TaxID=735517 RepID=A0A1M6ZAD4_9HYPH|nr:LysE family translocator [Roseibium suaedae]SHL27436.1 Threonine/homoserine/homoserine lactone efflux protein [Roseibium suaedae]